MNELALFAGAGGGILGGHLLGWRTVCAVEIDAFCREVLLRRQMDGCLPRFPIWDDIRTFDGKPWRGFIDVVSGGFPCQDISAAGRGAGIDGERSGLWGEMARVVREVGPRYVFVENSPMLTVRGLHRVLGDLAEMGYDAKWGVLGADDAGAPHIRKRIWILANARRFGCNGRSGERGGPEEAGSCDKSCGPGEYAVNVADADGTRLEKRQGQSGDDGTKRQTAIRGDWWLSEPDVGRVANGVAFRVDRLKSIGNGQVPVVVRLAWETLNEADE